MVKHLFDDKVDRSNSIRRWDGHDVWVAPASLAKHGLKNGQTLTKGEWSKLGLTLAGEWIDYVSKNR